MGKVIMSGVSKGMTEPVGLSENFADNTWEQIIECCETNTVPDTWEVGDQKSMTINGTDYPIDIIGKNHDTYASGGTAPLTFQLHDCYGTTYAMNSSSTNVGGWDSSVMRNTHLPAILALMPSEVQTRIKSVVKSTSMGNKSSSISTSNNTLFLLSEIELFGNTSYSVSGEGNQYSYYAAGNSKVKNVNGSPFGWWLRSPNVSINNQFCITAAGESYANNAADARGVAFAFCF